MKIGKSRNAGMAGFSTVFRLPFCFIRFVSLSCFCMLSECSRWLIKWALRIDILWQRLLWRSIFRMVASNHNSETFNFDISSIIVKFLPKLIRLSGSMLIASVLVAIHHVSSQPNNANIKCEDELLFRWPNSVFQSHKNHPVPL